MRNAEKKLILFLYFSTLNIKEIYHPITVFFYVTSLHRKTVLSSVFMIFIFKVHGTQSFKSKNEIHNKTISFKQQNILQN